MVRISNSMVTKREEKYIDNYGINRHFDRKQRMKIEKMKWRVGSVTKFAHH